MDPSPFSSDGSHEHSTEENAPPRKLFKTENAKPRPCPEPAYDEAFSSSEGRKYLKHHDSVEDAKDPNKRERRLVQNRKSALKCRQK